MSACTPPVRPAAVALGALMLTAPACGGDNTETPTATPTPADAWPADDAITYRDDLSTHAGCSTAGLSYPAASIPGFTCAAKRYTFPEGVSEDTDLPILLLVHGNSDTPASWERYPAESDEAIDQVAERAVAAGLQTIALDLRIDLVDDPDSNNETENAAHNVDHGWATPLAQHLIESVLTAYPTRRISLVGFSLGTTVVRDALRRIHIEGEVDAWSRIDDLILTAGANHGVSTYALCGVNPTMRGEVTCQMGDRTNYSPTAFLNPLNGPERAYEAPCADGASAYGDDDACGGNTIDTTTIVMQDITDGSYQDPFVSEDSASLLGADNQLLALTDVDASGYFFGGVFKDHYGSIRSEAALTLIMNRLLD